MAAFGVGALLDCVPLALPLVYVAGACAGAGVGGGAGAGIEAGAGVGVDAVADVVDGVGDAARGGWGGPNFGGATGVDPGRADCELCAASCARCRLTFSTTSKI